MAHETGHIQSYQTHARNGWVVFAHEDYPSAVTDLAVAGPGSVALEPVDASPHARVFKGQVVVNGTQYDIFLKQYLYRSIKDKLKHLVRPGRAMRNHTASILLTRHGFLCPRVIATACYRPWALGLPGLRDLPCCSASSTVSLEVTHTASLEPYFYGLKNTTRKNAFLHALGLEVGRLHRANIFHGDLRTGNVLVQEEQDTWRFWLLDNERTRRFMRLPRRQRVRNLVQIHLFVKQLSHTDRWRFFKTYCEAACIGGAHKKTLARQVIRKTRQRELARPERMPQS